MSLRRVFANPRLFRLTTAARPYSTAGYGNHTATSQNPESAPLDIEDPHEVAATPPPQQSADQSSQQNKQPQAQQTQQNKQPQAQQQTQQADQQSGGEGKPTEHDNKMKEQRKEFNRGDQDTVRQYSQGCD